MSADGRDPLSVRAAAERAPGRPALVDDEGTLTWAEVARRIAGDRRAARPGAPAIVSGRPDRSSVLAILAAIEARVPVAPAHPAWTGGEAERAAALVRTTPLLQSPAREIDGADRPLAALFTSGTSARPACVLLSRRAFAASARASAARLGWRDHDRWLLCLPTAHVGGLSIVTRTLAAARTTVLLPRFDPAAAIDAIARHRVTLASMVPAMLARMLDEHPGWSPPPHLRALLLGGAAAPAALLDEARARRVPVLATYGATETCSQVATQVPGTPPSTEQGAGPPLPGIDVEIAGDGEILVSGPTLLTARLGDDRPPLDARGRYATGDLGRFDGEGRLHVVGRIGDTIVTGGENVAPREIEALASGCPGVRDALAFGVADETWGEIVALAVTTDSPDGPDEEQLAGRLAAGLARFKRPRLLAVVERLPRTPAGKPDRRGAARALAGLLRPLPRPR